jgi:uncharacterized protein (TIGR02598 family)
MDTPKHSVLSFQKARASRAAFSLVEITMAIGIVSFAFLGVFGLIPTGLNTFRQAMDASVGSQIAQRVINDAQQTDFNTLIGGNTSAFQQSSTPRYFDDQGNEVTTAGGAIYQVNTCITPATATPSASGNTNPNLATVTVQIANNPGNRRINLDATMPLWNDSRFPMVTCSAIVSKNK